MIVSYKKYATEYKNILEITYLFLVLELLEFLRMLGMYDQVDDTFNIRKIFWTSILSFLASIFILSVGMASFLYIIRFFAKI